MWQEIRTSRGRDVPNSRPVPNWVRRFAWILDDAVAVPGTRGSRRVGIDGFVSLIPVVGDALAIALSLVIVAVGVAAGVSVPTVVRMLLLVGIEGAVGLVPLLGAVFNMAFKANNRNLALIEADLADRRATRRSSIGVLLVMLGVLVIGVVMLVVSVVLSLYVLWWLVSQLLGVL